MNVVSFDLPSGELLGLHGDLGVIQGNLLRGIDKKTIKAVTYNKRPKMKTDTRLKEVFSPRNRLLSVGHLSSGVLTK